MNIKHLQILVVIVMGLTACASPPQAALPSVETTPTPVPIPTATLLPQATPTAEVTPTLRSVQYGLDCQSAQQDIGHILFLQVTTQRLPSDQIGYYDLYIMDGNGCFRTRLIERVSSPAVWSQNGSHIAVACDENQYICIIDAQTILDSLMEKPGKPVSDCSILVQKRYSIPAWIIQIEDLTWSPDGSTLALASELGWQEYALFTLDMSGDGTWTSIMQDSYPFNVDWSPSGGLLAGPGIIDLETGLRPILFYGRSGQWLYDGKQIAYITDREFSEADRYTIEPAGIAIYDIESGTWKWLYEPTPRPAYTVPPKSIMIRDFNTPRQLSWSPNERYIAFLAEYVEWGQGWVVIYRLDTLTGEIAVLTAGLPTEDKPIEFPITFAPAWGP